MIAALYVQTNGCYFDLPDVDPWDEARDARKYAGPWPVVAHPPCARWCRLAGFVEKTRRERWFETSWGAFEFSPPCYHPFPVVSVVGHGTPSWVRKKFGRNPTIHDYREAMGIDWMNRNELSQAIPPAYTERVGKYLMIEVMRSRSEAA